MKTQDFTGTRAGLSKRGRASAARPLASIVLDGRGGARAGAKVSRMCYNPPKFGRRTSPQARPKGRGRRAINSGMEKNSVLRRLLVCALTALLIAAAAVPLAAAPAAAQEKKEQKAEEKP